MPATEETTISALASGTIQSGSLFATAQPSGDDFVSKNVTALDIANYSAGQGQSPAEYIALNTVSKRLIGAINELLTAINNMYPVNTASGAVATFDTGISKPLASTKFNISGSDVTSMNVYARGINFWDEEYEIRDGRIMSKNPIRVFPNSSYFFGTNRLYNVIMYDKDMNSLGSPSYSAVGNLGYTFTTASTCVYIHFALGGGTSNVPVFSINYPSSDHDYHAYDGSTSAIAWTTAIDNGYVDTVNGVVYDTDNGTSEAITPIPISTCAGKNYVWCDTGNSELGYKQDIQGYIDAQIS